MDAINPTQINKPPKTTKAIDITGNARQATITIVTPIMVETDPPTKRVSGLTVILSPFLYVFYYNKPII